MVCRLTDSSRHEPDWRGPGQSCRIADAGGPQLYCSPGFVMCNQPCSCRNTTTHHFDHVDHSPNHPYIAVHQAELEGADMSEVRESNVPCTPPTHGLTLLPWDPLVGPRDAWLAGGEQKIPSRSMVGVQEFNDAGRICRSSHAPSRTRQRLPDWHVSRDGHIQHESWRRLAAAAARARARA